MVSIGCLTILLINCMGFMSAQNLGLQDTGFRSNYEQQGYNNYDPNKLLNGFFPIWSFILLGLAGKLGHFRGRGLIYLI